MRLSLSIALCAAVVLGGCGGQDAPRQDAAAPQADAAGIPPAGTPGAPPAGELPADEPATGDVPVAGGTAEPAAGTPSAPTAARPSDVTGSQPGAGTAPARPSGTQSAATQPAATQSAAVDGAAALRRAAAAYENVRSLQADFVMNFENPLLRQRMTSRGALYQRQPDRIALRFTDPAGDLIVSDGQYFYLYYPSNNADQYIRQPAAAAGETAVNLQAQFVGNPVERFEHTHQGSEAVAGRQAQVLLLVPRQRAEYRSLRVWIDDRDSLVRRFEITEHNGSVRRFDLNNMQVNPTIPDALFRFTPPPGARAITAG